MTRRAVAFRLDPAQAAPAAGLGVIATAGDLGDALRLIAERRAQTLVVQQLGSVAGSLGELTRLLGWLGEYDADLVALNPPLDTSTAAGQQSVALLREIDRWGREPEHPKRPRGRPGLGHTSPQVAERIATLRERGLGLRAIADQLNTDGVPTPRGGAAWRASSVQSAIGYRRPRPPAPGLPHPPKPPGQHADKPPRPHADKPPRPHEDKPRGSHKHKPAKPGPRP